MKKLRIAMVVSNYIPIPPDVRRLPAGWVGAIEQYVYRLTNELVERGHDVTLFAAGNSKTKAKLHAVTPKAFLTMPKPPAEQYRIETDLFAITQALQMAEKGKFDIVHSHHFVRSLFFTPFLKKTKMVSTMHSPEVSWHEPIFETLGKYQRFVVLSNTQKRMFNLPKNNMSVIPSGIDIPKAWGKKSGKYLAFLGRIAPHKGLHLAVQVARKTGVPLEIVGSVAAKDMPYYKKRIEPYIDGKLIKKPRVLGYADVYPFLQHAKALIVPILWEEPFGLVMIEALANGTPVVAFNRGSVTDIVQNGKNGFVVNPGTLEKPNVDGLVDAVRKIDTIDRAVCRQDAETRFSTARMAADYEAVYAQLLRTKKE